MTRFTDDRDSPFWPALSADPAALARATRLAQEMIAGNPFFIGGALFDRALRQDPLAWANQHEFALGASTLPSHAGQLIAKIALRGEPGSLDRPPSPIARLLPRGSADSRQRGEWSVPGGRAPVELAVFLMSLGFVWSPSLQETADRQSHHTGYAPLMPSLQAILDARELEALPAGSGGKSGSRL